MKMIPPVKNKEAGAVKQIHNSLTLKGKGKGAKGRFTELLIQKSAGGKKSPLLISPDNKGKKEPAKGNKGNGELAVALMMPQAENLKNLKKVTPEKAGDALKSLSKENLLNKAEKKENLLKTGKEAASESGDKKKVLIQEQAAASKESVFSEKITETFGDKLSETGKEKGKKSLKTENESPEDKKVKVLDLRKDKKIQQIQEAKTQQTPTEQIPQENRETGESSFNVEERTLVINTENSVSAEGDGGKSQAPVMKEAAGQLKHHLRESGNGDIVKQAKFIFKDNDQGEIKLILKPESLGQVKINLNLKENHIVGQIFVENSSVKDVFLENMGNLSKAMSENGWDSVDLDVSLNDGREGFSQGEKDQGKKPYYSNRIRKFDDNGSVIRIGEPSAGLNITA